IKAGGSVFINTPDIPYEVAGAPESIWRYATVGSYDPGNPAQLAPGVKAVSGADQTAILAQTETVPNLIANFIQITAKVINLNGLIQSGKADYSLTLDDSTVNEINDIIGSQATTVVPLANETKGDFSVGFNPTTNRIEVLDKRVAGGKI